MSVFFPTPLLGRAEPFCGAHTKHTRNGSRMGHRGQVTAISKLNKSNKAETLTSMLGPACIALPQSNASSSSEKITYEDFLWPSACGLRCVCQHRAEDLSSEECPAFTQSLGLSAHGSMISGHCLKHKPSILLVHHTVIKTHNIISTKLYTSDQKPLG